MQTITASKVLTPSGIKSSQTLCIEQGVIYDMRDANDEEHRNIIEGTLIPGYVDTQVNGGGGILFNHTPTYDALKTMANAHLQFGTTSMLPTLITDNATIMAQAADAVSEAITDNHPNIEGIHFEGPFLSAAKKGVHEETFIRTPSDSELATLCRKDIGKVLLTVAPETVSLGFIKEMVAEGVVVALGHTNASFEQVSDALSAGATGFTHLYNAMSAFTSRAPGAVGAALLFDSAYCGLIVDHHHVHPKSAELAIKVKSENKIMLVTDAMAHVGSNLDKLAFFNTEIQRSGSKLTTPDGTLAGSCLDMHGAVVNTCKDLGISLTHASTMASSTPATFMGIQQKLGSIAVGQYANVLLVKDDLTLHNIWVKGTAKAPHQ
ncbi:N-acetylglucosamine-6-phosphate deacetylase [Alteromonas sp. 1_MG-2023]|uniref:N-acetylglucosamine-6-phosphate deacetylase n=1 Tax=Alteromonas sp. 1_MG-2023 TaxID=3062669 RepID=UPI0026E32829|nr:N-acetylglucosamine-6-phosphate deacetylase [Alteromonas sp. 1_MG-2023]MDO6565542.1 N-acetylglucosamine-6-phosphate deacetylase [Alteromonas sp. 1_MG-2023]